LFLSPEKRLSLQPLYVPLIPGCVNWCDSGLSHWLQCWHWLAGWGIWAHRFKPRPRARSASYSTCTLWD